MDRTSAPSLLPILRSQQQGEILALLLGDAELELSLTELATRTGAPHPSVHREIQRAGETGARPVGDIDLLILGEPDRDALYAGIRVADQRLCRPIEVTIRKAGWLETGAGSFHDTVATRPLVRLAL